MARVHGQLYSEPCGLTGGEKLTVEKLYSVEEAAEVLRISPLTMVKWLRAGKVRGIKAGRLWRVPESALNEVAQSGTKENT